MNQKDQRSKDEAIGVVRKFIKENYKYSESALVRMGYTIEGIEYNKDLNFWVIRSKIIDELEKEIWDKIPKFLSNSSSGIAGMLKNYREMLKLKEVGNFCFYINSYGKICALFIGKIDDSTTKKIMNDIKQKIIDDIKPKEKDINDIVKKTKEILGKGRSFKYIDYFPFLVARYQGKWEMIMLVIYYARFDTFPKICIFHFSSEGEVLDFRWY
ncbi:hypothetical protein MSIBF_A1830015 [groundwater metagenome]|uniref:Uncharacterized protein n=1 Tax=groundwater metagenome TaxID=717931 RepID=A0A098E8Z4_9ZZZZ